MENILELPLKLALPYKLGISLLGEELKKKKKPDSKRHMHFYVQCLRNVYWHGFEFIIYDRVFFPYLPPSSSWDLAN